eukprot:6471477-Amphidinium_carterae.1
MSQISCKVLMHVGIEDALGRIDKKLDGYAKVLRVLCSRVKHERVVGDPHHRDMCAATSSA